MSKKQFLYRIQPVRPEMLRSGPTPTEQKAVAEHFTYLQKLTAENTVLLAGRTLNEDNSSFGIVIFLAETETEAANIMAEDPAIAQRVMRGELFPYSTALTNPLLYKDLS